MVPESNANPVDALDGETYMTKSSKPAISDNLTSLNCFIVTSTESGTRKERFVVINDLEPRPTSSPFMARTSPMTSQFAVDIM